MEVRLRNDRRQGKSSLANTTDILVSKKWYPNLVGNTAGSSEGREPKGRLVRFILA
jgi:hypothetical protein